MVKRRHSSGGVPGEQDMPGVVVAVFAQRLTHVRVIVVVDGAAPQRFPVLAPSESATVRVVTATSALAVSVVTAGVDGTEAGCGQGGEHLGVLGDAGGHVVVSAVQPGMDQLPGVAGIRIRARGARDRASVVAPRPYLMLAAEGVGAAQMDWVSAEPE